MITAEGLFSSPSAQTLQSGAITVRLMGDEPPVRFAAAELLRYLPRLLPAYPLEVSVGPLGRVLAACGLQGESPLVEGEILVRGDGRRYALSGGDPAAVLHAAYAFLESLGARWVRPGPLGDVVHPLESPPPALALRSAPAFSRRGLTEGCLSWWPDSAPFEGWLEEMRAVVDWMGKMRLNRLFVHFNRLPAGDLSPLLPELEMRGIALELGGHSLPKLLPAGARESEPGLCREWEGERRPDGNFCTSNSRTLHLLREGARRYAEQLPPADLFHLWSYDAKVDPWCSCPSCRHFTGGDQMWRSVAAAAEGVAAARPGARVSGLLYHESLDAWRGAPPGVEFLFAPRERCYLHPIDGDCPRNRGYLGELRGVVEQRGRDISLLEYYGDPILLGRPANQVDLVAADLAAYRSVGARSVSTLVFGALSWWLYPVQLYGYARGAWDPRSAPSAIEEYSVAVAGERAGKLLSNYYRLEGEAAGTHLRFCGYGLDGTWANLPFPPNSPTAEARGHLVEMRRGERLLWEAGGLLEMAAAASRWHDPLVSALLAHRMEVAFHSVVAAQMGRPAVDGEGWREAFEQAVVAMEEAAPETVGVFGTHWMLPWLRRCRDLGRDAPV